MKAAEEALRPWVIRHLKARTLPPPWQDVPRRRRLPGKTIDPTEAPANDSTGLAVSGDALLPFLLAARATACTPESRPVFAEGLASSYEAFMHTRRQRQGAGAPPEGDPVTDQDEIAAEPVPCDEVAQWYLDRLEKLLPLDKPGAGPTHPKLAATVRRVIELWRQGEKVVVFCHYIATGKALRRRIGEALADEISRMGAEKLRCGPREAHKELDRIGQRFFDQDSPIRRACDREISTILSRFPELERDHKQDLTDIVRRYLRTPTFLVRYFPLGGSLTAESMAQAMDAKDASDLTLRQFVTAFLEFLRDNCVPENRCRYVEAVKSIQTGSHVGSDASGSYSPDELQGERRDRLLPNVRLVNGSTQQETRQRLMLAFNTPFYPEILVASSVMAEGVDLHLNCRYVIHHDLCWNPSMLEQRTGRIDRIGAKVEQCGRPIHVYLPYVGETQDEKMYRVVMDRERWFNVVMGEKFTVDAKTTDKLARRVPLPESVANSLRFKLDVVGTGGLSQGEPALAGPA
jgi:ERCC4-related helicase